MTFELFLFSTDPTLISAAMAGGAAGLVIDWENVGKPVRQEGADTEINADTVEDLVRVRAVTDGRILCRINAYGATTADEVAAAIAAGADEIILPMARGPAEVEATMELAGSDARVGMLVETNEAVERLDALGALPLSRVYVGLNDLSIARGHTNIFVPVVDGTVDAIRDAFDVPFGFAGLTLPEAGRPIPCQMLIAEMARLRCDFSFLRRSFRADVAGRDPAAEMPRILDAVAAARERTADQVRRDRERLHEAIAAWDGVRVEASGGRPG